MGVANAQFMANGNIYPSRFVMIDSTTSNKVLQATANAVTEGISYEGTNYPPLSDLSIAGYAAAAGQGIRVYQDGEVCLVEAAESFNAGTLLKADGDGKAVAIATTGTTRQNYGAEALEASTGSGQKIRVKVLRGKDRPALV